jgi:hypothetical protein
VSKLAPIEKKSIRTQQEIAASRKEIKRQVKNQKNQIVIRFITQTKLSFLPTPKIVS